MSKYLKGRNVFGVFISKDNEVELEQRKGQ